MLKGPFIGPTFLRYYNANVGLMMTFSVRSSKIRDLQHWGRTIYSKKNKLDGQRIGSWIVLKLKNIWRPQDFISSKV